MGDIRSPNGKEPTGCKWILIVKHKAKESIENLKTHLVARSFT